MKCKVPVYGSEQLHLGLSILSELQTTGVQLFDGIMFEKFIFCTPQYPGVASILSQIGLPVSLHKVTKIDEEKG